MLDVCRRCFERDPGKQDDCGASTEKSYALMEPEMRGEASQVVAMGSELAGLAAR
jgi:hypothetical protein